LSDLHFGFGHGVSPLNISVKLQSIDNTPLPEHERWNYFLPPVA
jgi:hypothetical protein